MANAAKSYSTLSVSGSMQYYKKKMRLTFREGKPEVYKLTIVRGPVIRGEELINYAANAAHVPATTVRQAKSAIFDAIAYFCAQGRVVQIPSLGSFCPRTTSKTVHTAEETTLDTITRKKLVWVPKKQVADLGKWANISLVENKKLTELACPEAHEGGDDDD
jgi:nucleoid DNA-binding protein